jgi:hypothetical protein
MFGAPPKADIRPPGMSVSAKAGSELIYRSHRRRIFSRQPVRLYQQKASAVLVIV